MSKPNGIASVVKWIPLVVVVLGGVAAWAQQQEKTTAHERRIGQNEKIVRQLETGQATILERTRQTREITDETKEMVKEVLRELRRQR